MSSSLAALCSPHLTEAPWWAVLPGVETGWVQFADLLACLRTREAPWRLDAVATGAEALLTAIYRSPRAHHELLGAIEVEGISFLVLNQ